MEFRRDCGPTPDQHVKCLIRSCFFQLRNIAKPRSIVSQAEMNDDSHFYCNSLFTCPSKAPLDHLQVVQNAAAKLLTRSSKRSHVTPNLISLHWLPIKFWIQFKVLVITYRALHGQVPAYIKDLLPFITGRSPRSSDQVLFLVPPSRLKPKGDRAFEFVAPKLWNTLPLEHLWIPLKAAQDLPF